MCSKWKVTSQGCGDDKIYAVYRLKDTSKVQHSGNMEFATEYMDSRSDARAIADKLNGEEV